MSNRLKFFRIMSDQDKLAVEAGDQSEMGSSKGVNHPYPAVLSLQEQLGQLTERMEGVLAILKSLSAKSRRDEIKLASDAVKDTVETSKLLDEMLVSDAHFIMRELEQLMLKEDEKDSAVRLKRQLRASGSGEDVEGLRKQIETLSSRLLEAQSHKLLLETRLVEKDRSIKQLEDSLANTMADMKHVRAEAQKSFIKHDKKTKEAESRVKSMSSELKRANEMATKYKALFENERRRRTNPSLADAQSAKRQQQQMSYNGSSPYNPPPAILVHQDSTDGLGQPRSRSNTAPTNTNNSEKQENVTATVPAESASAEVNKSGNGDDKVTESELAVSKVDEKNERGADASGGVGDHENIENEPSFSAGKLDRSVTQQQSVRRKYSPRVASPNPNSPWHFAYLEEEAAKKTCLKVEDIIRKNHQYLEEAEGKDNEVKLWRALFIEMTDKIKAYYNEMMRCQGEVSTLYEERMDLKARLQKEQKDNGIMRKELERHAASFIEYKKLQFQLSEEIKWSKLKPLAPTKIYSKSRPKSVNRPRPINVENWAGS
ncbi:uncharacterized protein LOC142350677 [Convolutriloba macropyga]|uniref:uncharacterized protein LOC142350677 n=1 Tax=Convolutriloba macropyga TaxID=536237 RepID=UPI003F520523